MSLTCLNHQEKSQVAAIAVEQTAGDIAAAGAVAVAAAGAAAAVVVVVVAHEGMQPKEQARLAKEKQHLRTLWGEKERRAHLPRVGQQSWA